MDANNVGPLVFMGIMSLKIYLMRLPSEKRFAAWALADVKAISVWFSGLIVETAILGQPRSLCGYLRLAPWAVDNECLSVHSMYSTSNYLVSRGRHRQMPVRFSGRRFPQ